MKKYKLNINLDNNTTITTDTALPIPNKTSDLTNDSGFITTDTNYYPSRTYTSGLKISNSNGVSNTCELYVPYATTDDSGLVTTAAQTFSGTKTFVTLDGDTIGAVMPNTSGWTASRTIATLNDIPNITTEDYAVGPKLTVYIDHEVNMAYKTYYKIYDGVDATGTLVYENNLSDVTPSPQAVKITSGHFYIDCKSQSGVWWWGMFNSVSSGISNNTTVLGVGGDNSHGAFKGDISSSSIIHLDISWND